MTQENKKNSITQKVAEKTLMWNMSGLKAMTEEESKEWHKKHSYVNEEGNTVITTEDLSKLLLKDLCARLPYGVMVNVDGYDTEKLIGIENETITTKATPTSYSDKGEYPIDIVKPYLRPMSSMTEEETKELLQISNFNPDVDEIYDDYIRLIERTSIDIIDIANFINWLNAHHFDYRGLIEKGLAIEASEGMYK